MQTPISLRTHNILDYMGGLGLLASPFIFNFDSILIARDTFFYMGAILLTYSALTNYSISLVRMIPLGIHMTFDVVTGLTIMGAPWLFHYSEFLTGFQLGLHFILGLGLLALVAYTHPRSDMMLIEDESDQSYRLAS